MKAKSFDPIAVLRAANPLPAAEQAALGGAPEREQTLAVVLAGRTEGVGTQGGFRVPALRRATIVAAALIVLAVPALAFSGQLGSLFGFSNQGTSVDQSKLDLTDVQVLKENNVIPGAGIKLLATRAGVAFYASRTESGVICLLTGAAGERAPTSVGIECLNKFPSPQQPILNHSLLMVPAQEPSANPQHLPYLLYLRGLAADGVAKVEALDSEGNVVLEAPVIDNVYATTSLQPSEITSPIARIVALDANGNIVYTESEVPGPGSK